MRRRDRVKGTWDDLSTHLRSCRVCREAHAVSEQDPFWKTRLCGEGLELTRCHELAVAADSWG